jgi:hypothetical protein
VVAPLPLKKVGDDAAIRRCQRMPELSACSLRGNQMQQLNVQGNGCKTASQPHIANAVFYAQYPETEPPNSQFTVRRSESGTARNWATCKRRSSVRRSNIALTRPQQHQNNHKQPAKVTMRNSLTHVPFKTSSPPPSHGRRASAPSTAASTKSSPHHTKPSSSWTTKSLDPSPDFFAPKITCFSNFFVFSNFFERAQREGASKIPLKVENMMMAMGG